MTMYRVNYCTLSMLQCDNDQVTTKTENRIQSTIICLEKYVCRTHMAVIKVYQLSERMSNDSHGIDNNIHSCSEVTLCYYYPNRLN